MDKITRYIKIMAVPAIFMANMLCHANASQFDNIIGRWIIEQVFYDDGTVNQLEADNFVDINTDTITEVIKGYGNRQYPYTRQDNVLTLTTDDEQITWQILRADTERLEVTTPIGKYVLTR